jgi:hypothetical protein
MILVFINSFVIQLLNKGSFYFYRWKKIDQCFKYLFDLILSVYEKLIVFRYLKWGFEGS